MAPISSSESKRSSAAPSSFMSPSLSALSCLGRLSVIKPTRPRTSVRMFSYGIESVLDRGHRAQLVGRGRSEAEEFEVRGNLLEQHVGAHLDLATLRLRGFQEWCVLRFHHDLADEGFRRQQRYVDRQRIAFLHAERRGVDHDVVS